jgi:hypothetical protein
MISITRMRFATRTIVYFIVVMHLGLSRVLHIGKEYGLPLNLSWQLFQGPITYCGRVI